MDSNSSINRRNFLKSSLLTSGALVVGSNLTMANAATAKKSIKPMMRKLGNTGIELPVVSAGKLPFDNPNITTAAYNRGVRYFDTAWRYDGGKHEEMLGETITKFKRSSYILGTKSYCDDLKYNDGKIQGSFKKEQFLERFETSLKRLQVEYVDILYFHGVNHYDIALLPEALETLKEIKASGKARHIGISTHNNETSVLQAAIDSEVYEVVMVAYNFKQNHYKEIEEKINEAAAKGVGIIAMKNMAGGFLDKEKEHPVNYKAALKWGLKNPNVCTTVPQMKTYDALALNLEVMTDIALTEQEKNDLNTAKAVAGLYCDGCNQCIDQCANKLPIPELMRSYMYAHGYRDHLQAKEVVLEVMNEKAPCSGCDECVVTCPKGFNVSEKIADIIRVKDIPDEFLV